MCVRTIVLTILLSLAGLTDVAAQQSSTGLRAMAGQNDALAWQAVGRLDAARSGFCTATLIAPDLVLTAAHCVYHSETNALYQPRDLTFRAGLRKGQAVAARKISQIESHPGYDPKSVLNQQNIRHDVALLRLAEPITTDELDPFVLYDRTVSTGPVSVVSYGRNREHLPSRQDVCQVQAIQQDVMVMDCNVTFGSSGAPVFTHRNGRGQIVSVISGMARTNGRKVALGMTLPDVVATLKHRMWANKQQPAARIKRVTVGSDTSTGGAKFIRP